MPMEGIEVMHFETKEARREYIKHLAPKYKVLSMGKVAPHNAPAGCQYKLVLGDITILK